MCPIILDRYWSFNLHHQSPRQYGFREAVFSQQKCPSGFRLFIFFFAKSHLELGLLSKDITASQDTRSAGMKWWLKRGSHQEQVSRPTLTSSGEAKGLSLNPCKPALWHTASRQSMQNILLIATRAQGQSKVTLPLVSNRR